MSGVRCVYPGLVTWIEIHRRTERAQMLGYDNVVKN